MRMRLIDAEPLKELFPDNGEGSWTYNATAKAYIDAQPTIQPDIIHCEDCKHYIRHDKRCGYWNHGVKPTMWCSQAERREVTE